MVNETRDPVYVDCEQADWDDVYELLTDTQMSYDQIETMLDNEPALALTIAKSLDSRWFDGFDTQTLENELL